MQALRLEATCTQDGMLTLRDLPLHRGDAVEIVIFARNAPVKTLTPYPLRGEPATYLLPTAPVADADWEWEATR